MPAVEEGAEEYVLFLMVAGMVSSLVSLLIDKHSFYDHLKMNYLKNVQQEDQLANQELSKEEQKKE